MFRKDLKEIIEYSPGKTVDEVKRELGLERIIKLASNEVPFSPSSNTKKAIQAQLKDLNRYPDPECYELRRSIATKLKLDAENIVIGHGSNELVRLLIQIVAEPGDEVVMPSPSFIYYKESAKLMKAQPIEVSLKDNCLDLASMKKAVTKRTKAIFICNPNNPTASIVSGGDIQKFLRGLPKDILVIFDEAYYEFVQNKAYRSGLEFFKPNGNIVVLRTFSKAYGLAGLRIGYGVANVKVIAMLRKVKDPFNVNSVAQAAALTALADHSELKARVKATAAARREVCAAVKRLGLDYVPTEANFVLIQVPEDADRFTRRLLELGVIVRSGKALGYPQHIRVTFGNEKENRAFLKILAKALQMI